MASRETLPAALTIDWKGCSQENAGVAEQAAKQTWRRVYGAMMGQSWSGDRYKPGSSLLPESLLTEIQEGLPSVKHPEVRLRLIDLLKYGGGENVLPFAFAEVDRLAEQFSKDQDPVSFSELLQWLQVLSTIGGPSVYQKLLMLYREHPVLDLADSAHSLACSLFMRNYADVDTPDDLAHRDVTGRTSKEWNRRDEFYKLFPPHREKSTSPSSSVPRQ